MEETLVDRKQLIGTVKERNQFYKALVEIRDIANKQPSSDNSWAINITNICDETIGQKIDSNAGYYWDCECESSYIHHSRDRLLCPQCKTSEEMQPESIAEEVSHKSNHFVLS